MLPSEVIVKEAIKDAIKRVSEETGWILDTIIDDYAHVRETAPTTAHERLSILIKFKGPNGQQMARGHVEIPHHVVVASMDPKRVFFEEASMLAQSALDHVFSEYGTTRQAERIKKTEHLLRQEMMPPNVYPDPTMPRGQVDFRGRDGRLLGSIKNLGMEDTLQGAISRRKSKAKWK